MARKNAPPAPPPSPDRVASATRTGNFTDAIALARQLHADAPAPDTLALLKRTLTDAAIHFAERDKALDFNRIMDEADRLDPDDAVWAAERACLLARGGRLSDALMRAEDEARPRVLGHAVDRALRHLSKEFLPDELHSGFDAVIAAFKHHEAGKEPAAREVLEAIGLRSPFLEWKLLLRGLLAHAVHDDARAAENFARLDPSRLPVRLAAPYRAAVDPSWKASLPGNAVATLAAQLQRLTAGKLVEQLRAVAREIGRDKPLAPGFRAAESVLPQIKTLAPSLLPRLANCFYQAILTQGQPDDLARYRRLFGNPTHDPHFHKLQALIAEQIGDCKMVHDEWRKYEEWLATNPPGWSPAILARARAEVWLRLGDNATRALEEPEDDDEDDWGYGIFSRLAPRKPAKRKKPKPLDPPALECYRRASQFAPDRADAASSLFNLLVEQEKPAEAEAAARTLLANRPDDLKALNALAAFLQGQGRADEAAELFLRAAAINPLDKSARRQSALAVLAQARRELIAGRAAQVDAVLAPFRAFLDEELPAAVGAVRAVAASKLGKPDEAAALRERAMAYPDVRLGVAYHSMVDSQLAKLKPADKRAAEQLYAAELAKPPWPLEVHSLIATYDSYFDQGISYRSQKSHEKKILDLVGQCATADAPELDFEYLCNCLLAREDFKPLKKFADACHRRFPRNPHFVLIRCEVGLLTDERTYHIESRLVVAKRLAEVATEPRHRELLPRIEELLGQVATPFRFLDSFFERPI